MPPHIAMNPTKALNELAKIRQQRAALSTTREAMIGKAIAPVKPILDRIDKQYATKDAPLAERETLLDRIVREAVIAAGTTIKGTVTNDDGKTIMAVYNQPRVSWDAKLLDGMAVLMPEIAKARKVAEAPTVAISWR